MLKGSILAPNFTVDISSFNLFALKKSEIFYLNKYCCKFCCVTSFPKCVNKHLFIPDRKTITAK